MATTVENKPAATNPTRVERASDREIVITRHFSAPARIVFAAWTRPELLVQWWAPQSTGVRFLACDNDVRTGGSYRFKFAHGDNVLEFFGKYIEVVPDTRLVWTNEENAEGAVTTVTFAETDGTTRLVLRELYPSAEALTHAIAGMEGGMAESFAQLDALLPSLIA